MIPPNKHNTTTDEHSTDPPLKDLPSIASSCNENSASEDITHDLTERTASGDNDDTSTPMIPDPRQPPAMKGPALISGGDVMTLGKKKDHVSSDDIFMDNAPMDSNHGKDEDVAMMSRDLQPTMLEPKGNIGPDTGNHMNQQPSIIYDLGASTPPPTKLPMKISNTAQKLFGHFPSTSKKKKGRVLNEDKSRNAEEATMGKNNDDNFGGEEKGGINHDVISVKEFHAQTKMKFQELEENHDKRFGDHDRRFGEFEESHDRRIQDLEENHARKIQDLEEKLEATQQEMQSLISSLEVLRGDAPGTEANTDPTPPAPDQREHRSNMRQSSNYTIFRNYSMVMGSAPPRDDNDDNNNGTNIENDTFSLMMMSKVLTHSWALGLAAFLFQIVLGTMIAFDQISLSTDSSVFDVPFMVDPVVRVGQFFSIVLCLATQSDILTSVQSVLLLSIGSNWDEVIGEEWNKSTWMWLIRILLPNLLKFCQGLLVLYVSFVIIVQSDDIIDLLKDFTALMVLAETDNILFHLASHGYLGQTLMEETAKVSATKVPTAESTNRRQGRAFSLRFLVLLCLFAPMVGGWVGIVRNQLNGTFFSEKYPKCNFTGAFEDAKEHFGDGVCYGGRLNTLECAFEGKDCVNFNLAFPLCKGDDLVNVEEKVGNGKCDPELNMNDCNFDGGDCTFETRYPNCPHVDLAKKHFGDGVCYGGPLNTLECEFEGGDCATFNSAYPLCKGDDLVDVQNEVGNGKCNNTFNKPVCNFDGGDCPFETRYPDCTHVDLAKEHFGDGVCYGGPLNTLECEFEDGDCINFNLAFPLCKGDNRTDVQNRVGNGICDKVFISSECDYDGGDCCPYDIIKDPAFGDGNCDEKMNTEGCDYDKGDCDDYNRDFPGCPYDVVFNNLLFGNGQCNGGILSTARCDHDNKDCDQFVLDFPDCPLDELSQVRGTNDVTLGDGMCESGIYNIKECGYENDDCNYGQIGQTVLITDELKVSNLLYFSKALSLDGMTMALGLPVTYEDGKSVNTTGAPGLVKVWRYNNIRKMWLRLGSDIVGHKPGDTAGFRTSLSADGNRIMVSSESGLRLYNLNVTSAGADWSQVGQTVHSLGSGMASDGSKVAVVNSKDEIHILSYDLQQEWVINPGFDLEHVLSVFKFNSLDGSRLLVSAGQEEVDEPLVVKVFQFDPVATPAGSWTQMGQAVESSRSFPSLPLSTAISADGNRIVVSSKFTDVFDYDAINNIWVPVGNPIKSSSSGDGDGFGFSINLSSDGNLLVIASNSPKCHHESMTSAFYIDECTKGSVELYIYHPDLNRFQKVPPKPGSPYKSNGNILNLADLSESSISGIDFSMNGDGTVLWTIGYNVNDGTAFIETYNLDQLFYIKCAVIDLESIGDGECNDVAPDYSEECGYDGGDCGRYPVDGFPECIVHAPHYIGDGEHCHDNPPYNSEECGFDGGDCVLKPVEGYPECVIFQADHKQIGNGDCWFYSLYNSEECGWDGGDCPDPSSVAYPTQAPSQAPSVSSRLVQAENYSDEQGTVTATAQDGVTQVITYFNDGDYLTYNNIDFGSLGSTYSINLRYSDGSPGGKVQIRIDGLEGRIIGEFVSISTPSWESYTTVSIPIDSVVGVHDLTFVAVKSDGSYVMNIDWFELSSDIGGRS